MAETRTKIGRMVFESVRGNKYTVEIYKRGATATAVRELTPASNPFSTRENTSDDPMEPVRGSTGYMRFWYEGGTRSDGAPWWMDFVPADATEIKVVLKDSADAIQWQGYAQPSQYSHDYNEPQQEIELPLVSMLEVLGAIEMDATNVTDAASWRKLLVEAIKAADWEVETFHIPYEWGTRDMSTEEAFPGVKDFNCLAPFVSTVSRFAWFDTTGAKNDADPNWREYEGATYKKMLEDWCRFWGWTMRERGKDIYFVSRRTTEYRKVAWTLMSTDEYMGISMEIIMASLGPSDMMEAATTISLSDDKLDGIAHTMNMAPAVRTIEVDADSQEADSEVIKIDEGALKYMAHKLWTLSIETMPVSYWMNDQIIVQKPETENIIVKSRQSVDHDWAENTDAVWRYWGENALHEYGSGWTKALVVNIAKRDLYNKEEEETKKNFSYVRGVIISNDLDYPSLRNECQNTGSYYRYESVMFDAYKSKIVTLKGAKTAFYKEGSGYFAINMRLQARNWAGIGSQMNKWRISVKVGKHYWTGEEWTTTPTTTRVMTYKVLNSSTGRWEDKTENVACPWTVEVEFENFDEAKTTDKTYKSMQATTVDGKTLSMDCNGAEGLLIPISADLEGVPEVSLFPLAIQHERIVITDMGMEFFPSIGFEEEKRESVNKYYALTGATGKDTKKIELMLSTDNNNNPGYGLLRYLGDIATGTTYRTPSTPSTTAVVARPEEVLLSTARGIYGESQKRLEMVVTVANRERPIDLITRAEWTGTWQPVAESIEWVNDRRTLMLMQ